MTRQETRPVAVAGLDPIKFAADAAESVSNWLHEMSAGLEPGRFRFTGRRSLVPTSGPRAHFVTCWAAKSYWHVGRWGQLPPETRTGCTDLVKSLQADSGDFVDSWVLRRVKLGHAADLVRRGRFSKLLRGPSEMARAVVRAETRQAAATLFLLGDRPVRPLNVEWDSQGEVRDFLDSLDWANPWAAGSHASHLVVLLHWVSSQIQDAPAGKGSLIDFAFSECDRRRDAKTGTWGVGDITPTVRVNGAMKMLTAYKWTGKQVQHAEQLIDFTLSEELERDGCSVLDKLFVLSEAGRWCEGYRRSDIERVALEALEHIRQFRRDEGGFSFYVGGAQRRYYGAPVSLGGLQSDMHGTTMLTWATALALELLGVREETGWMVSTP